VFAKQIFSMYMFGLGGGVNESGRSKVKMTEAHACILNGGCVLKRASGGGCYQ